MDVVKLNSPLWGTLSNHSFLDHIQTQMLREFFSDYYALITTRQ